MKSLFFSLSVLGVTLTAEAALAMPVSEVAELQFHKVNQGA